MSEDVEREYSTLNKSDYYWAQIASYLAEIAYDLRGQLCKNRASEFTTEKSLLKFNFRQAEVPPRYNGPDKEPTQEELEHKMRSSKSAWLGFAGIDTEV